jgi:hypothetical protein
VKKPSGGSTTVSGPRLTPKQKAERDRGEAAKAREEAARAREEAKKAGEEAKRDERRAAADRKRGERKFARQEIREARADLARERRDEARAERDMARSRRDLGRARTAGLARAGDGGEWVLGGNDRWDSCAAVAVANSLLLATGQRLSDDEVLGLHVAAGGDGESGASVLAALEAAGSSCGAAARPSGGGRSPAALLRSFGLAARHRAAVPLIVELALQQSQRDQSTWDYEPSPPWGTHAVLLADGFAVTWGRAVPVTPAFLEHQVVAAWRITWKRDASPYYQPRWLSTSLRTPTATAKTTAPSGDSHGFVSHAHSFISAA